MRFINELYTATVGNEWTNQRLLAAYEKIIESIPIDDAQRDALREFVQFQLVGERSRHTVVDPFELEDFKSRAAAYERGANLAIDELAAAIERDAAAADVAFDAVVTTTSTGNLMPGLSYRMARRLGSLVRRNAFCLDLGNVGCTGSSKALMTANAFDPDFRHVLVVAVEMPTTLLNLQSAEMSVWQGNCTFGDGAAAVWISNDPQHGSLALGVEEIQYRQFAEAGIDLIRWGYGQYYHFELEDHSTFEKDVKQFVASALREAEGGWKEEPRWAIHPAGITLLMRLSRELKIPKQAIEASARHYRGHSNMSSASVLYVLRDVAETTPADSAINLLTMGAGFNVVYGRLRRAR